MGQLKLIRGTEWYGRLRNMYVFIDDQEIGSIPFNDYKDFKIPDGNHVLYIKIDVVRSKPLSITIDSSRTIIYRVRLPDVFNPLKLLISLFDGKNQISFEPESTDARITKF